MNVKYIEGTQYEVYFADTSGISMEVDYSFDESDWVTDYGSANSPRIVNVIGGEVGITIYFRLRRNCEDNNKSNYSNTYIFYSIDCSYTTGSAVIIAPNCSYITASATFIETATTTAAPTTTTAAPTTTTAAPTTTTAAPTTTSAAPTTTTAAPTTTTAAPTTTTAAPTTTTAAPTTAAPSNRYSAGTNNNQSSDVCFIGYTFDLYSINTQQFISNGSIMYDDPALTSPHNGSTNYYLIDNGGTIVRCRIGATGSVSNITPCTVA
jgi:hypothetical protein